MRGRYRRNVADYPVADFLTHRCLSGTNASLYFGLRKSATTLDIRYTAPSCSVPQSGHIPTLLGAMLILDSSSLSVCRWMSCDVAQKGHLPLSVGNSLPHFGHVMTCLRAVASAGKGILGRARAQVNKTKVHLPGWSRSDPQRKRKGISCGGTGAEHRRNYSRQTWAVDDSQVFFQSVMDFNSSMISFSLCSRLS